VRVLVPESSRTPTPAEVAAHCPVVFARGADWLLEVTFDGGRQRRTVDLRPDLSLLCHL